MPCGASAQHSYAKRASKDLLVTEHASLRHTPRAACAVHKRDQNMGQTRPTISTVSAMLALLSLGGCASLCGAPPSPPLTPPVHVHRGAPPSAMERGILRKCLQSPDQPPVLHDGAEDIPVDPAALARCLADHDMDVPLAPPDALDAPDADWFDDPSDPPPLPDLDAAE